MGSWASSPSAPSGVASCSLTRDRRSNSPRSWASGQNFSGAVPGAETASPSPGPWVNLFPAVPSAATKSVSHETSFLSGSRHARGAYVEAGMGPAGGTAFVPHP